MRLPQEIAGFDSASAMVVALARFLRGQDTPPLGKPAHRALRPVAAAVARMPEPVRQTVYSVFSGAEGVRPARIAELDVERVFGAIAGAYPRRRYPVVVIGSSGGALVHLCAAIGAPWLPQTVLLPVRQRGLSPDAPEVAMHAFDEAARGLLDRNPDLVLHHMHDPNQDQLTLRRMGYFRVKKTRLGPGYRRFLESCLEPGGTIVLAICGQRWPVSVLGDRHLFQLGAVGGLQPGDYHRRFPGCPAPDRDAPEAEWGFEPALEHDIRLFADESGFQVRALRYERPEDLSAPTADLYRWWNEQRGLPANRLIVDSFMLLDPWWTLRTGSVPYWTVFPVQDSLTGLHRYLDATGPWDHLLLGAFCHGVRSAGYVTADQWCEVLRRARLHGAFAGVDPRRYPSDPLTFWDFNRTLREIPARHAMPDPLPLDAVAPLIDLEWSRR
ncbi:hypothetical protein GCM10010168_33830 [Actinoplanes ianthinogenes]|uniref:hypothetical protein n=1 Tax=Actinoplanes ianthinogenes TaxID=122358 RepID=UPI00166FD459|nr:hypothetical protein [Actinoplanes ianthinogenes]GGR13286.1 hypothetical protein GCM10010168_33830 [Actinoplanes ianthinogenes]